MRFFLRQWIYRDCAIGSLSIWNFWQTKVNVHSGWLCTNCINRFLYSWAPYTTFCLLHSNTSQTITFLLTQYKQTDNSETTSGNFFQICTTKLQHLGAAPVLVSKLFVCLYGVLGVRRKMSRYCSVLGCGSNDTMKGISFYRYTLLSVKNKYNHLCRSIAPW